MLFEKKRPKIEVKPMVYGEYLTLNKDMIPVNNIPLETKGFLVEETYYGTEEDTKMRFNKGDWLEEEYVKNNFNEIL